MGRAVRGPGLETLHVRDPMIARVKVMCAIVVGIILGTIYQAQDINGALFVTVTNLLFGNIFSISFVTRTAPSSPSF